MRALVLLLLALCSAPVALGADAPRSLEIALVGKLADDATFGERVTSWFEPAKFLVVVRKAPELDASRVLSPGRERSLYIWVSLEGRSARLYFAAAAGNDGEPRFLLRDLPLANGLDEIGAEHVAEVLHFSALALLEGELSTPRAELVRTLDYEEPKQAAIPRAAALAPVAAPSPRFEFGLGYGLASHSEEGFWHGPRASVSARLAGELRLALLAESALPSRHDLGELELEIQALELALALSARRALNSRLALDILAGAGVELVDYAPVQSALSTVRLGSGATEARPNLLAGVGLVIGRAPWSLALLAELTLSLAKTHYDLAEGTGYRVIAEPALFTPRFGLEARF